MVTRPHGPFKEKGFQIVGEQCIDATNVSAALDAISVTFFDLSGLVYAVSGIHAACALTETRELTAEEERILSIRPVHAEPMPRANNRDQGIMMLVAKDTERTVAISPASSNYGVVWEAD